MDELEKRMTDLEGKFDEKFAEMMALIKQLQDRPVGSSGEINIDFDQFANREDFLNLVQRMELVEKRNLE